MATYVALLRGINVGGKNLIKMPALKAAFEADGFEHVTCRTCCINPRCTRVSAALRGTIAVM